MIRLPWVVQGITAVIAGVAAGAIENAPAAPDRAAHGLGHHKGLAATHLQCHADQDRQQKPGWVHASHRGMIVLAAGGPDTQIPCRNAGIAWYAVQRPAGAAALREATKGDSNANQDRV